MKMNKIEKFFTEFKNTITVIAGLLIVVGFWISAANYIDDKIEKKITDERYIKNLAQVLRPFAIFDEKGVIKYDHGALNYIKDIKTDCNIGEKVIIVTTTKYLKTAPLIAYYGPFGMSFNSEQVDTYRWIFKVVRPLTTGIWSDEAKNSKPFYIIEIIP